jgi:hypothetical protein
VGRYHVCPGCRTRIKHYFACKACWAWLRDGAPALALAINRASRRKDYDTRTEARTVAAEWFQEQRVQPVDHMSGSEPELWLH